MSDKDEIILKKVLDEAEKEKRVLSALCSEYTVAYCCDLRNDYIEPIKQKKFSHSAKVTGNLKNKNSYSEWMTYSYEHLLVKESAPDYLEVFDARNLMKRMEKEESFIYPHQTLPNEMGMEYFELVVVRLYEDDGQFKVVLGYRPIDDIVREEKKNREQLEMALKIAENANQAKTDFLRRMSHDIRTPINGILGMIEIAERYKDDAEKTQEFFKKMRGTVEYLVSIVNNVLDMGKLESGEIILNEESFDLIPLLMKQLIIVEEQAKENGLKFYGGREMSTIKHRYLKGSPVHLNRALMNLANNAMKYNRKGGSVTLYCTELSSDEDTVVYEFICKDDGLGMSEEFQKRAFEPFTQEGKESISMYAGSGLGLSIVQKIIKQMNGEIYFESKENQGTTFRVTIPFRIDHLAEAQKEEEEVPVNLEGKKVLLVEDNELNTEIAKILLEDEGMIVHNVENGEIAFDTFASSELYFYDVILMDIMMPVMDGLDATKCIRSLQRADAKTIPIIAMSANAFQDDIQRSLAAGMNRYLTKPLDTKKMKRVIREVLSKAEYMGNNGTEKNK